MLFNHIEAYRLATVKVNMHGFQQTNQKIKNAWSSIYPEYNYEYEFLDEKLAEFYEGEQKMTTIFTFFSLIAIIIGCLGLFGLASFMVNQKVKEIGVRKVLGATVTGIVMRFTMTYFKLILIAFILAVPASWFVMNNWLENFKYRIETGPGFYVAALVATLVIAAITVGFKSVKAASANPVDSLRSE